MSPRPSGVETMDFPWRVMYPGAGKSFDDLGPRGWRSDAAGVRAVVLQCGFQLVRVLRLHVEPTAGVFHRIEQGRVGESCRRLGLSLVKLRRTDRGERHVFDKVGRDRVMSADIVRFVVACVLCLLA